MFRRLFLLLLLLRAAVPCRGAADDFAPPDDSLFPMGRYVYERNCVLCHGRWGDGDGELARGMIPKPRKFSAGIFKYRSTPPGVLPTTDDLIRTVRGGRANTSMPAFVQLSDRELRAVVEYVKSFSPKWRKRENHAAPVPLPPTPAWLAREKESAARVEKGRTLFALSCAACHGDHADGKGPSAAALRDSWDDPCPPADLRSPAYRNGRAPEDIFRVLTLGVGGTPMPSFAETLTEEQRWELVGFVQTLSPPAAKP